MSYNIDTWKTKILKDLRIPLKSFFKHERKDWHPDVTNEQDGTTRVRVMESEIAGKVDGEVLVVSALNIRGEGSGTAMYWIFEPAFKDSIGGELVASCVWEGGDSINQITVRDGIVEWKDIEI